MSENILTIENLSKTYPNGIHALKNISFKVQPKEFIGIIGLSGSGKSTLLRCLNRMHQPTEGKIIFAGQDLVQIQNSNEIRKVRKEMGMIFQQFNLIPRHTVLLNVLTGRLGQMSTLKSILHMFSDEDKEKALSCLRLVGISEKAHLRVDQLSGGQQQRVAIARALAQEPQILLADEPVASLDPATCHLVMDYLKKINQELGITILCNLHFLSLVRQYTTRVIALKAGEIVYEGSPSEINEAWFKKIYGEKAQDIHVN